MLEFHDSRLTSETFTYDAMGNRISDSGGSGWNYDNRNRLTSYPGETLRYDARGNRVENQSSDGVRTYTFNYDGRMSGASLPDGNLASYRYDVFGRRVERTMNGVTTNYLYDGIRLIGEADSAGEMSRVYFYGPADASPWGFLMNGNMYIYVHDHMATPVAVLDRNGAIVWQAAYSAFGAARITRADVVNNIRFPGQYSM